MADIEELEDILAEAGSNKSLLKPHFNKLLGALLQKDVLANRVAYKIMAGLVALINEGILDTQGDAVFGAVNKMFTMAELAEKTREVELKRVLNEIIGALFSAACAFLRAKPTLTIKYIPDVLSIMMRDGNTRWTGYGLVAPLLAENILVFSTHVELLLRVMMHFPGEVLSVISGLYRLQPQVFDANISLLIGLYALSPAAQLSILHILHEIGLRNEKLVEPYLIKLRDMCNTVEQPDEKVVEIKEFVEEKIQSQSQNHSVTQESESECTTRAETDITSDDDDSGGTSASASEELGSIEITGTSVRGVLAKRGRVFGMMTRRWFTLDGGYINFFKNSKRSVPTRRIAVSDIMKVSSDPRHPHAFIVQTRARSIMLSAASDKEKEMWVSAIEKQMTKR